MIRRLFSRSPLSPEAQAYRDGSRPRVDRRTPWSDLTFVVLDAETTGFNVDQDRLLAIATVEVRRGCIEISRTANWLVRQPNAAVNAAVAVHGILPHDTAEGMPEVEVMTELLPRLTGAVIVGHHIGFDAAMIDQALRRHHGIRLRNPLIDTARLAMSGIDAFRKTGYANQRPPTLEELCAHTGLPVMARHTAAGDAFTTAQLFLLLCARLRRRLGRDLLAADLPCDRL
jgi:DNA polymerase III subunit epsilon